MPQMSPIKWIYMLFISIMNLFYSMFFINSMPKKLKYNKMFKFNKFNSWKWTW